MSASTCAYACLTEQALPNHASKARRCESFLSPASILSRLWPLLLCSASLYSSALLYLRFRRASPDYLSPAAQAEFMNTIAKVNLSSQRSSVCGLNTGGTCSLFPCNGWRGQVYCVNRKCMCRPGYCSHNGQCDAWAPGACLTDTGGTCYILPCDRSRGETSCKNRECHCATGKCANSGKCISPGTCSKNTGGTCRFLRCDASRGWTKCDSGRCLCHSAYCADNGQCVKEGECSRETMGTCRVFSCFDYRGPTKCSNGRCICRHGYCARDGICMLTQTVLRAHVVGVNQTHPVFPLARGQPGEVTTALCVSGGGSRSLSFTMGVIRALEAMCFSQNVKYLPLNMVGHRRSKEVSAEACQIRCGRTMGCVYFSFWPDGGCHLQDHSATRLMEPSAISGPAICPKEFNLMSKFEAFSSGSGGTWAMALYMFGARYTKEELLGTPTTPESLTLDVLSGAVPQMGTAVTASMYPFLNNFVTRQDSHTGDRLWTDFMTNTVLAPLKLDFPKFMASSVEEVHQITSRNPNLASSHFIVPRQDRARVFVMNAVLLAPSGYSPDKNNVVSLQIGPDWIGSPFFPNGHTRNIDYKLQRQQSGLHNLYGLTIGGGFLQSFAFGSAAPQTGFGEAAPKTMGSPGQPFSLSEAVGVSSCAPAGVLSQYASTSTFTPEAVVWPVTSDGQKEMLFKMGDGGSIENAALLPMLQRGAKKILWLVNTDTGIKDDFDWCGSKPREAGFDPNLPKVVTNQMTDKFGYPDRLDPGYLYHNQVFPKGTLAGVVCELQKLKRRGKVPFLRTTLGVLPNSWWGIKGNYPLDVAILYLDRSTEFEDAIKDEALKLQVRRGAEQESGPFKNWPHFKTINQNPPEAFSYTNEQVNLLAALGEYAVNENRATLSEMLA